MDSKESGSTFDELRRRVNDALQVKEPEAAREIERLIEELQNNQREQEEQVGELRRDRRELEESRERFAEIQCRKDEFLAILTHALRNPLAPIFAAAERLHLIDPNDPVLQRQREIITRQASLIARTLDNLLEVSRILRGKMRLRKGRLDLREVMDRALEDTRLALQERSHHLTYRRPPEPLWLTGDAERLQQIFHNLIENAIKYTEAGGTIEVLVEREPAPEAAEEPWAVVRVRDSGVGITREALPQIFDLFARAGQPLERSQGGLGIGLTMARHLVEMHGGTIEVFSAGPGKGSTFTVRLPVVQAIVPEAEKTPLEGQRTAELRPEVGKSRRVLVVEDNLDSARSLSDLLVIWGHQVRIAYEGPAALETALAFRPDVALVDIGLPGMNGYQLARLIRTQPTLKETLLVALTGYGQEEDRRQAEEAGFDRHFTKPIDLAELQVLVGQTPLAWRQRELQS